MTSEWLTTEELSERLGGHVSPKTLVNWRQLGKGPRWHKLGKRVLYRVSDVEAWEEEASIITRPIHPE